MRQRLKLYESCSLTVGTTSSVPKQKRSSVKLPKAAALELLKIALWWLLAIGRLFGLYSRPGTCLDPFCRREINGRMTRSSGLFDKRSLRQLCEGRLMRTFGAVSSERTRDPLFNRLEHVTMIASRAI